MIQPVCLQGKSMQHNFGSYLIYFSYCRTWVLLNCLAPVAPQVAPLRQSASTNLSTPLIVLSSSSAAQEISALSRMPTPLLGYKITSVLTQFIFKEYLVNQVVLLLPYYLYLYRQLQDQGISYHTQRMDTLATTSLEEKPTLVCISDLSLRIRIFVGIDFFPKIVLESTHLDNLVLTFDR